MDNNKEIIFTNWSRILYKNDSVILCNMETGVWINIPQEIYNIITDIIVEKITLNQLKEYCEEKKDYEGIKDIIKMLFEKELLCHTMPQHKNELKEVQIAITNQCNLNCLHCCYRAGEGDPDKELNTEELKRLLDKIIETEVEKICLTGGEPLMRKDFWEIVDHIRNHYVGKLSVMTNGTLIGMNNVSELVQSFDDINISVDGIDKETCERIRGEGVFSKVMNSIRVLKKYGAERITLSMVLTNENNKEQEFRELCRELGVNAMVRIFSPVGRGFDNKEKLIIDDISKTDDSKEAENIPDFIRCRTCKAGKTVLHIDYDGSIYPCGSIMFQQFKLGNKKDILHLQSFLNSMENNDGYIRLQNAMPEKTGFCKDCNISLFCHTCPGVYLGMLPVPEILERHCRLTKRKLTKLVWEVTDEE